MNKYVGLIFYIIFIIYYWKVLDTYDYIYYQNRRKITSKVFLVSQKFHQYYFTVWNFNLQVFFVVLALCSEIVCVLRLPFLVQDIFNGLRSYLYCTIVFPSTIFVSACFWTLYIIDRNLIMPPDMSEFYPKWMNHSVHTAILITVIMECILPRKFPTIPYLDAIKVFSLYALVYVTLFISIYLYHRIWLYPIFFVLTWGQRFAFIFVLYIAGLLFLGLGIFIQNKKRLHLPE